jgi:D-sedoheptulose 7-phosphate isomerase
VPDVPRARRLQHGDRRLQRAADVEVRVLDAGDVLIALSGSGNSPNIVKALEMGNALGMKTFAILGYSGGRCRDIARYPLHFAIDDMQVAEDLQLIVGHMCMQWLKANPVGFAAA